MKYNRRYILFALLLIAALFFTPYVSESPDGLEASLEKLGVEHSEEPIIIESPMPDYTVPVLGDQMISGISAGIAGTVISLVVGIGIALLIRRSRSKL